MAEYDPQKGHSRSRDDEGPAPVDALLGPDPDPDAPAPTPPAPVKKAAAKKAPARKTPAKKVAAKKAAKKTPAKKTPAKKAAKATKKVAPPPDPVDDPEVEGESLATAAAVIADLAVTRPVTPDAPTGPGAPVAVDPPRSAPTAPSWPDARPPVGSRRSRGAPIAAVLALVAALLVLWTLLRRRRAHPDD